MTVLGTTLVDTKALLNVVLLGFSGGVGLVLFWGLAVLAQDRLTGETRPAGSRAGWASVLALGLIACVAMVALGAWAMTQKS
jgi:hypothetical protein